ncbi:hypothetical protein ACOME3_001336 [Neoechinorhynchus agilis]
MADKHFDASFNFLFHELDKLTNKEKVTVLSSVTKSVDLLSQLIGQQIRLNEAEMRSVVLLKELLERITCLDPQKRISLNDAIAHPFLQHTTPN